MQMTYQQYVLIGSTVRSYLAWLEARGEAEAVIEEKPYDLGKKRLIRYSKSRSYCRNKRIVYHTVQYYGQESILEIPARILKADATV